MAAETLAEMTLDELLKESRRHGADDLRMAETRAELERRQMLMAIKASRAQIRSAWFQLAAVVAMFLTTAISVYVQLLIVLSAPN